MSQPPLPDTPHRKRDSGSAGILSGDSTRLTLDELQDHVFTNIPPADFLAKLQPRHAEHLLLDALYDEAVKRPPASSSSGGGGDRGPYDPQNRRWTSFPHPATEAHVVKWFGDVVGPLIKKTVANHPSLQYHAWLKGTDANFLHGTGAQRRVELVTSGIDHPVGENTHDWRNVRSFCELRSSTNQDFTSSTARGVQMADYGREILHSQPTRLAVQGCAICDDLMRCVYMDRAGIMATEEFSIHENPRWFLGAMVFYTCADAVAVGFDPTVTVARWSAAECRWRLVSHTYDPALIHWPASATGPASAPPDGLPTMERPDPYSHRPDGRDARVHFLLHPEPVSVASAENQDCEIGKWNWDYVCKIQWREEHRPAEGEMLKAVRGIEGVVRYHTYEDCSFPANGTLIDTTDSFRQRLIKEPSGPPREKHMMFDSNPEGNKESNKRRKKNNAEPYPTAPLNRILTRLVTSPHGRPLESFRNVSELLRAVRAGLRGHQQLLCVKGMLHRDISVENIMLPPISGSATDVGVREGFLIDLDLAVSLLREQTSGARTGTPHFMAIAVLQCPDQFQHTFRHDLESFLYVLIWICTRRTPTGRERKIQQGTLFHKNPIRITRWARGTWSDRCEAKIAHMSTNFDMLLGELEPEMSTVGGGAIPTLLTEWRNALFETETVRDPERERMRTSLRNETNMLSKTERMKLDELKKKLEAAAAAAADGEKEPVSALISLSVYDEIMAVLDKAIAAVEAQATVTVE